MEIQWTWIAWSLVCLLFALGLGIFAIVTYPPAYGSERAVGMDQGESDIAAGTSSVSGFVALWLLVLSFFLVDKGAPWLFSVVFP